MLVPAAASHPLHFLADNTAWAAWRGERGAVSLLGMEPRDYPHSNSSPAITPAHLATKVARVVFSSPRSVPRWELQPMTRLQTYKSSSWNYTPTPANLAKCTSHGLILQGLQGVSREWSFSWSILSEVSPRHSNPAMTRNIGL